MDGDFRMDYGFKQNTQYGWQLTEDKKLKTGTNTPTHIPLNAACCFFVPLETLVLKNPSQNWFKWHVLVHCSEHIPGHFGPSMSTAFLIGHVPPPVRFCELCGWDGKETEAPPLVGMASADRCKVVFNGTWNSGPSLPSTNSLKCAWSSTRLACLEFTPAL